MTPKDDYAFVGDPQFDLFRPEANEVHISVTFTWDIEEGKRLVKAWSQFYDNVKFGGPAFGCRDNTFTPGMYINHGVTFTSRGCNRRCKPCLVPEREGKLRLLPIVAGHIVQDNNLLQTGKEHMDKVFDMLRAQKRAITFSGGLQASLVDDWVIWQLKSIPIDQLFLAADKDSDLPALRKAINKLSWLPRKKLRCYVLLAFDGETIEQGEQRLEAVWDIGCLPFAQLYQPPDQYIEYPHDWTSLQRTWSRPAATVTMHKEQQVDSVPLGYQHGKGTIGKRYHNALVFMDASRTRRDSGSDGDN